MKIKFATEEIQEECACFDQLVQKYGVRQARRIRQRLDELDAAANLADFMMLPASNCRLLNGEYVGQISIDTAFSSKLLIEPINSHTAQEENPMLDWTLVTAIRIISIDAVFHSS